MSTMIGQRGRKSFSKAAADLVNLGRCVDIYSPDILLMLNDAFKNFVKVAYVPPKDRKTEA